jgi:hypothetical protein
LGKREERTMDWEGAPWIGRVLPGSEAPGQPKQNKNKSWLQRFGTGKSLREEERVLEGSQQTGLGGLEENTRKQEGNREPRGTE